MTALAYLVSALVLLAAAGYRVRAMRRARARLDLAACASETERRWRETR